MINACILSHIYKCHTSLPNPNSLADGANAFLLWPLSLSPDYTTVVALVFSLRRGAASFSTPPETMGRHGHDGPPCLLTRHDTVKEP